MHVHMHVYIHIHVHVYTYCTDMGFSCLACTSVCLNTTTLTKFNTDVYIHVLYTNSCTCNYNCVVIEVTVYVSAFPLFCCCTSITIGRVYQMTNQFQQQLRHKTSQRTDLPIYIHVRQLLATCSN